MAAFENKLQRSLRRFPVHIVHDEVTTNLELRKPVNNIACGRPFSVVGVDMNQGVIHLHGHVHLPPHLRVADGKAMDVGVDGNGLELDDKELKSVSFDPGDVEDLESMNVHYVAITRPKHELYFMMYEDSEE